MTTRSQSTRIDWVDAAKGICIVLVVMMHATLGVEKIVGSETWLHAFIDWARPFRMPDFFLISGLFLASRIDRPWRSYLDTKVLHFAYFYVLWLSIQFAVKSPSMIGEHGLGGVVAGYVVSFIDPFGTLWFIYLLAVFFVAAKLLHDVPKTIVLVGAAALHVLAPNTGSVIVDEFTDRFVFFYTGYAAAPVVFAFVERAARLSLPALVLGLIVWSVANAVGVQSRVASMHGPDLAFSYAGIAAIISFSTMIARWGWGRLLAHCGRHSIAIYLAFTLFMAPARVLLLKLTGGYGLELTALAATAAGVIGPLILERAVADSRFAFLFTRPEAFRFLPLSFGTLKNPDQTAAAEPAQ